MKLNGSQVIAADRMAVWNALNDAEVLKRCISGCEEMNRTSPTQYDAIVKQKIGPVSATFKGEVNLSDIREGESLTLKGEGKGGVAGMAKGGAVVTLTDVEGGTLLSYDADASVAGKLAQLGSRLIDGVAQKMANGFFESFKAEVETGSGAGSTGGVSITNSSNGGSVHASAGGSGAMAAAAGTVGAAGAAASAYAGSAMQGARDSVDAHTGALHDAAAERMLNPAIGMGSGDIDMDDPEIGDIDVSSVDGGPSEGDRTAAFDAARAAGSQGADGALPDVAGNLAAAADRFDPDAAVGQVRDHVGTMGDGVSAGVGMAGAAAATAAGGAMAAGSGMMDRARTGAQDAADRVGERVSAGIGDAQAQVGAMGDDAVAASRSAMEGARDSVSGRMDAAGDTARGAMQDGSDRLTAAASSASSSASSAAGGAFSSASSSASAGMDRVDSDMQAAASAAGAAPNTTLPEGVTTESSGSGMSAAGMAAGAAAVGGIGAAVSGFAARAQDQFDETHENVRDRVIAAGGDVDEAKSWGDTKEHLGRAASETRDTAQDVYDAARARVEGDHDRASAEWNEAKTNASEAYGELKGAGEDAWTTGKGYAAEEAKAPKIGPLGQPWYLWIIGIIVLLVILWIL